MSKMKNVRHRTPPQRSNQYIFGFALTFCLKDNDHQMTKQSNKYIAITKQLDNASQQYNHCLVQTQLDNGFQQQKRNRNNETTR